MAERERGASFAADAAGWCLKCRNAAVDARPRRERKRPAARSSAAMQRAAGLKRGGDLERHCERKPKQGCAGPPAY